MYQFKYGVLPSEEQDRKYCQVKGDAGLYEVGTADSESVTITSGARTGEVHSISKVRFLSAERMSQYDALLAKRESIEASIGALVDVNLTNHNFSIYYATMPFVGASVMNLTDHFYVSVGEKKPVLVSMELSDLCSKLNQIIECGQLSDLESEVNALAFNLILGGHYEFFDPLTSPKPTTVIIRRVVGNSIFYSVMKTNKQFSDVEKSVSLEWKQAFRAI